MDYILFIDSGIGGISILKKFKEMSTGVNTLYYADTANFPYGNKPHDYLTRLLTNIYNSLSNEYKIIMVVIACNTASVTALEQLRQRVSIPVIGTVPAIKKASELSKTGKIGVIATENTIKQDYIYNLIKQFAADKDVTVKACPELVTFIEKNTLTNTKDLQAIFEKELSVLKNGEIDYLVLGCTHYSFLIDQISDYLGNKVNIIDSSEGVSKRILSLLNNKTTINGNPSESICIISKTDKEILDKYIDIAINYNSFDLIKNGNGETIWQKV